MDSATRQKALELIAVEIAHVCTIPIDLAEAIVDRLTAAGLSIIDTRVEWWIGEVAAERIKAEMVRIEVDARHAGLSGDQSCEYGATLKRGIKLVDDMRAARLSSRAKVTITLT